MIAKITRGADPGRIGAYLHGPGRVEEHIHDHRLGGAVIAGTIPVVEARSPVEWVAEMHAAIDRRPDITRPVWQASLRAAPGDRVMTDGEWAHAAQGFAERMGFDGHPWVAVRHGRDHIHVVVSRVDHDGQVWHGRFDRRQAQQACAQLEVEHRLTRAPRTRGVALAPGAAAVARHPADGQLKQGEWQRAVSTKVTPTRVILAERVHTAAGLAAGRGRAAFEDELRRVGVTYQANEASTGRMNGYRFADPAHRDPAGVPVWFKASQLDKSLSWAALSTRLEDPPLSAAQEPPRRRLQTRTARARDLTAAHDAARAARETRTSQARQAAHRALQVTDRSWTRTWQERAAVDPVMIEHSGLRRFAGITAQVGDVVNTAEITEYLEVRRQRRLWEQFTPPARTRPARHPEPSPNHETARPYIAPTRDHDHGLGR